MEREKEGERDRNERDMKVAVEEVVEKTAYSNCTISGANQRSKYCS